MMPTITLSVTEDLKKRMDAQEMINWSAVARNAIEKQLDSMKDFALFEKIVSKSKLTEKDAKEIGDSIKRGMAKRFLNEVNRRRKRSNRSTNKK